MVKPMSRCRQSIHFPTSSMPMSYMLLIKHFEGILAKEEALVRKHWSLVLTGLVGMPSFIQAHSHFIRLVRHVQFITLFLARYVCRLCVICSPLDSKLASVCNYSSTKLPSVRLLVFFYFSRLGSSLLTLSSPPYRPCCILALLSLPRGYYHMVSWFDRRRNATCARLLCAHDG